MLALAWPMVLTNLGQTAMTATDVMMMGRLGPDTLASGALGANLYFMPLIFGLGLMLATSPMIATELGRRRHSVRDLRRTVRQGLWLAILICIPIWIVLWHGEAILLAMGQEPALAHQAGIYLRWLRMGGAALLRLYRAALLHLGAGAAGLGAGHRLRRGRLQRLLQLGVHVRQSRRPVDGHRRLGPCHHAVQHADVRRHGGRGDAGEEVPPLPSVRALLARRLAALQGRCCGSACRSPASSPSR